MSKLLGEKYYQLVDRSHSINSYRAFNLTRVTYCYCM